MKTETEAIDAALNLVVFIKILKSLEKLAAKSGVEKVFVAKRLIETDLYIDGG